MATTTLTISTTRLAPLTVWHLLSLDAPTVATLWTVFAARALHQPLLPTLPTAMFLAVWLLYAADRLLDTRTTWVPQVPARSHRADPGVPNLLRRSPSSDLQPRHHFHRTHRTAILFAILLATLALAILVPTLPRNLLRAYFLLAGLLAAWFSFIHLTPLRLPKEFAPGPFFAAAIFLPFHPGLLPPILFAALCTLNCLYIHAWEHPDTIHPTTRRLLNLLALALALLPLIQFTPITIAITFAALALLILHLSRHRLAPTTLRAAADLALLTPLLVLPFLA